MLYKKPFYLMRHAETKENVEKVAYGSKNTGLTVRGINQIKKLNKSLSHLFNEPYTIYHSSLVRAHTTAKLLAKNYAHLSLVENAGLNEQSFGEWEGHPWLSILDELKAGHTPPNGESRRSFAERICKTLNLILSHHNLSTPPIIVAHGGTFFAIGYFYNFEVIDIPNCFICYFKPKSDSSQNFPWSTYTFNPNLGTFALSIIYHER